MGLARSSALSGFGILARRWFVKKNRRAAATEGDHPDICFGWGYVGDLATKKIKGLHENDFIVAAKIDRLVDQANP